VTTGFWLLKNRENRGMLLLIAGFQLLMLILLVSHFPAVHNAAVWLMVHFLILFYVYFEGSDRWNSAKIWSIILIIPLNFTELHDLVHVVHPHDFDPLLIRIDHFLLGVNPTVWLERLINPWLTEILQIVYSTFYFLPIILGILLIRSHKERELHFFVFQVVYGFYLSYIGYFLLPALGPRFSLESLQTVPLTGVFLMEHIHHLLNSLENIQRDAFPSGHTEMTLLTAYYAAKYNRPYFYAMIVISVLLIFSTVYLRYHYVTDVIAGALLMLFVVWSGKKLYAKIEN